MRSVIISIVALSLAGCASSPDEMTASYVSPVQYQSYDCSQIGAELQRVTRRANGLYGQLNKTASDDNAQMAVGMILFTGQPCSSSKVATARKLPSIHA